MSETTVPAGWYADPSGHHELRYWDGRTWTDHVSTAGRQAASPLAPPPDVPVVQPPPLPPRSVATEVDSDAEEMGFFERLRHDRREKVEGRERFEVLATRAAVGDEEALAELPAALDEARGLWRAGAFEAKRWEVMARAVREVVADDLVDADEEAHLHRLGDVLGTPVAVMPEQDPELFEELVVAGINAGRLPVLDASPLVLKRGEVAHGSFGVQLLKEVAVRELRGGSQGLSVPIGGGVRYRVGGFRGRSVVVGSELVVQDSGVLVVTSTRTVFIGQQRTLEHRHDRLVGLEQFADGLRLNVSNRQATSLFRMLPGQSPTIAAALVSAAAARA